MYNEKELLKIENKFVALVTNIFYLSYQNNTKLNFELYKPQLNKLNKQLISLAKNDAIHYIGEKYYPNIVSAAESTEEEILTEYMIAYFLFFSDNINKNVLSYSEKHMLTMLEAYQQSGTVAVNRYMRTAINDVYNQLLLKTYELANVSYFEFVAVMDSRTSEICSYMNGKILNSVNVYSYMPPLHPNCRSRIVPIKSENINKNNIFNNLPSGYVKQYNWFKNEYAIDLKNMQLTLNNIKI